MIRTNMGIFARFKISKPWRMFSRRGGILVVLLGATLLAYALGNAVLPASVPAPAQPGGFARDVARVSHFPAERLETFSGWGFGLFPDLTLLLNLWEAEIAQKDPPPAPAEDEKSQWLRFVNPEYVSFSAYRLKTRDNLWKIAKEHGYTIDTIVGCNPGLRGVVCRVGQEILLPSRGGCLHSVQGDETLDSIALDYAVAPEEIRAANFLDSTWLPLPGMWLFIPGAKPRYLSDSMRGQYSKRALFQSPLSGRYTSFVGMRIHPVLGFSKYHNGVDISCKLGTWVGACASGVVIAAGWGGAVGKYIKIDHQNGYQTVYGHLNQIFVHTGQNVKRGQLIGRSGATGRVTGPHLHFTIYENGRVVDPMDYLW